MAEPENLVLHLLQEMRAEIREIRAEMLKRTDLAEFGAELGSEMKSLRADVASDLVGLERRIGEQEKRTSEQIVGLRRAVVEYHSSVIGHGVLISDLDERVRRLEPAASP